jgi:hypothetical protein
MALERRVEHFQENIFPNTKNQFKALETAVDNFVADSTEKGGI